MSDEEIAEYALELRELKVNSKPIITSLTMLAGEIGGSNPAAADAIAGVVEKRIRTSEPKQKLTALYLLDSIAKNVGGHFLAIFAKNLPTLFADAYAIADQNTRKSLARLFNTWRAVFPQATLGEIERSVPPHALGAPATSAPGCTSSTGSSQGSTRLTTPVLSSRRRRSGSIWARISCAAGCLRMRAMRSRSCASGVPSESISAVVP